MRILHVISGMDSRGGGPAIAMAGLAKAQRAAGLEIAALATWTKGSNQDIADDLTAAGIHVTRVGPAKGALRRHPQLVPALRAEMNAADVLHIHGLWEEIQHQSATIARQLRKPYVVTPHGMLTPWSLRQKWLKKKLYLMLRLRADLDRAGAIHFTSNAERDLVAPLKLKPRAIVETLGVDLREFETLPPPGSFRARFPAIRDRKIILFLGRLHPGKGMEYLIPAMERLQGDDALLVAVGPDSMGFQSTLEDLAREHRVADRVLFTGMLRGVDRIAALVDATVFALPSEHENFGVVVIEALAAGTPVVVSDAVALKDEIVAAGVGSATPIDVDRIAAELRRWIADPALRQAASEKARPFVWREFDWAPVAARWVEHYRRLALS